MGERVQRAALTDDLSGVRNHWAAGEQSPGEGVLSPDLEIHFKVSQERCSLECS